MLKNRATKTATVARPFITISTNGTATHTASWSEGTATSCTSPSPLSSQHDYGIRAHQVSAGFGLSRSPRSPRSLAAVRLLSNGSRSKLRMQPLIRARIPTRARTPTRLRGARLVRSWHCDVNGVIAPRPLTARRSRSSSTRTRSYSTTKAIRGSKRSPRRSSKRSCRRSTSSSIPRSSHCRRQSVRPSCLGARTAAC
jgi:hypothetical protein